MLGIGVIHCSKADSLCYCAEPSSRLNLVRDEKHGSDSGNESRLSSYCHGPAMHVICIHQAIWHYDYVHQLCVM